MVKNGYHQVMARPREFNEERVLRAAADVFRRRGFAGASLEELVQATGLGKGSLYGAYGSKHGLYLAALDRYAETNVGATTTALTASTVDPVDELRAYLHGIISGSTNGSPSCLLTVSATELADHDSAVAGRVREAFDGLSDGLRATVARGQADGRITAEADAGAAADLLLVVARGIDVLAHAGVPPERLAAAAELAVAAVTSGGRDEPAPV